MISTALAIAEFILHLFTGKVWSAWQAHKESEAQNAKAKVDSLDHDALRERVEHDIVRR
jgi:hypothetical protein